MPPPDTDLAARVRAGMAFLDERLGAGWESAVDVERLDMSRGVNCVLGQLWESREGRGIRSLLAWISLLPNLGRYGFIYRVRVFDPSVTFVDAYAALTAEWRAQLAARRAGKVATT